LIGSRIVNTISSLFSAGSRVVGGCSCASSGCGLVTVILIGLELCYWSSLCFRYRR